VVALGSRSLYGGLDRASVPSYVSATVTLVHRARAGRYAEARYRRGLKSYRRRMRTPLLIVVVPMFAFFLAVVLTHKLDDWSVAASIVGAGAVATIMLVRDAAPQHVLNWQRGAEGERRTEKALRRLERKGWTVEHDVQRDGRANLDHVVRGPGGVFLLETKNLLGTITFEDGVLQARQFDDPDEIYRYTSLAARVRGQAYELSSRIRTETGRGAWVTGVVVIWGSFEQALIEHENVTYISGSKLAPWLEERSALRQP
jgi:hypothetical protein